MQNFPFLLQQPLYLDLFFPPSLPSSFLYSPKTSPIFPVAVNASQSTPTTTDNKALKSFKPKSSFTALFLPCFIFVQLVRVLFSFF